MPNKYRFSARVHGLQLMHVKNGASCRIVRVRASDRGIGCRRADVPRGAAAGVRRCIVRDGP